MQLHWGWAVLGALALGVGLAWWMQPVDKPHTASADANGSDARPHARSREDAGPTLYRWVDTGGVVNITDKPPAGRHYTIVHIDPNRNIVPMGRAGAGNRE
ncbi:MAG TPA: DUF4124 domain-containing protein [Xanthomonadaceae bacterium]|jgi:hypothetical protein|nr:DUF4124 domain-containing protein [Xanthomonadaceae bacterium]